MSQYVTVYRRVFTRYNYPTIFETTRPVGFYPQRMLKSDIDVLLNMPKIIYYDKRLDYEIICISYFEGTARVQSHIRKCYNVNTFVSDKRQIDDWSIVCCRRSGDFVNIDTLDIPVIPKNHISPNAEKHLFTSIRRIAQIAYDVRYPQMCDGISLGTRMDYSSIRLNMEELYKWLTPEQQRRYSWKQINMYGIRCSICGWMSCLCYQNGEFIQEDLIDEYSEDEYSDESSEEDYYIAWNMQNRM